MFDYQKDLEAFSADEKKRIKEVNNHFDEFLVAILLILRTTDTKSQKIKQINTLKASYTERIGNAIDANLKAIFSAEVEKARNIIEVSGAGISDLQEQELLNLSEEARFYILGKVNEIEARARAELLRQERVKLRSKEGMGADTTLSIDPNKTSAQKLKMSAVFTDSKGRQWTIKSYLDLVFGDALYKAVQTARVTTWVEYGRFSAKWHAFLDDRTTDYCRSMNGVVIDVKTHVLPPAHPRCRSWIEILS